MAELWGWLQIGLALLIMALCGALICAWVVAERRLRRQLRGDKKTRRQGDKETE